MTWQIEWGDVTTGDVRRMPFSLAQEICRAVVEFAQTGKGTIETTALGEERLIRVRVAGAAATGRLELSTKTFHVWRIYQT